MKKISVLTVGTMFLALASALSSFTPSAPKGASANGQGSLTLTDGTQRRFSFHANTMPDGSVQGSGVLTYTGGDLKIKFDINCLIVTGNTAVMSGVIISHSETPAYEGTGCWFQAVDNGEGSNGAPDQLSLLAVNLPVLPNLCSFNNLVGLSNVEGGNVQVKP